MRLLFLILVTLSTSVVSETPDRYRGAIYGYVTESNDSSFTFHDAINKAGKKQKLVLSQSSGQKAVWTEQALHLDASQENKYWVNFEILNREDDSFDAKFELFENFLDVDKVGKTVVNTKQILQKAVSGDLNSRNEYSVIADGEVNFHLTIEIDREFTLEEIKQRHLQGKTKKLQ